MLYGKYLNSFDEATHALPDGMNMNADYPFVSPKIIHKTNKSITLEGRMGKQVTVCIKKYRGKEFCHIEQRSSFEKIYDRKPTRFKCYPFMDKKTANQSLEPTKNAGSLTDRPK